MSSDTRGAGRSVRDVVVSLGHECTWCPADGGGYWKSLYRVMVGNSSDGLFLFVLDVWVSRYGIGKLHDARFLQVKARGLRTRCSIDLDRPVKLYI